MTVSGTSAGWGMRSWPELQRAALASGARVLPRGGLFHSEVRIEQTVACIAGCVWLTADTEPGDIVLRAGESRQFPRKSHVLIESLEDSRIRIS